MADSIQEHTGAPLSAWTRYCLTKWIDRCETDLFGRVLPFWLLNSPDETNGGFYNCLDKDGQLFDRTKHVWLQGREVWMLAKMANSYTDAELHTLFTAKIREAGTIPESKSATVLQRSTKEGLLNLAVAGLEFLRRHAVDGGGDGEPTDSTDSVPTVLPRETRIRIQDSDELVRQWKIYFSLTEDGKPIFYQRKPFSASFLALALSEVARGLQGTRPAVAAVYRREALSLFDWFIASSMPAVPEVSSSDLSVSSNSTLPECGISDPADLVGRPSYAGSPAWSGLAVPMILLNLWLELSLDVPQQATAGFYPAARVWAIEAIRAHVIPERKVVLENVNAHTMKPDFSTPDGRLLNPGHAIECGWFLLDYEKRFPDPELRQLGLDVIDWSFERGWDIDHDGILYFLDIEGFSPVQLEWSQKLWWPHCEAMISFAYAFSVSRSEKHLESFEKVADYCWNHFVDHCDGEWYGYLDRKGLPTHRFKGGPYKGCYHVPRSMWLTSVLLRKALSDV